ncbi:MAG: hypothetical protein WBL50_23125, partial [Candidatus Acidiferrum sp.]
RRFGSAMISNTDSMPLVYPREHIRVKAYKEPMQSSGRRVGMHRQVRLWRVRFEALRASGGAMGMNATLGIRKFGCAERQLV